MILLEKPALHTIADWLHAAYPHEGCGLLVGTDTWGIKHVERAYGCPNRELRPNYAYVLDPKDMLDLQQQLTGSGMDIIGIFHSHPNISSQASSVDLDHAFPEYSYVIAAVDDGKIRTMQSWVLGHGSEWVRMGKGNKRQRQMFRMFREETLHILP